MVSADSRRSELDALLSALRSHDGAGQRAKLPSDDATLLAEFRALARASYRHHRGSYTQAVVVVRS